MAKPLVRLRVVEVGLAAALVALLFRAAQVQLVDGRRYAAAAKAQRTEHVVLEARRGALYDRHGTAIALTQETYHLGIAPNELRDPSRDIGTIVRQLHLPRADLERGLRRRYAWFAGPFTATEVQPLRSMRGVHLEPLMRRFYPSNEFARAVIGRVGEDGRGGGSGGGGLERLLDSLLSGTPGSAVVLKDREGREYESPARVIAEPVAGNDVVLTLDVELQEIAQRALDDAIDNMEADGGDVVMLDPATGEILAVASRRADGSMRPSAFTETFEPGSLAKIFAAAALITFDRIRPGERVSGEGGTYRMPGRPSPLTDEHPLPSLTLADAIRVSSNIALAKFSARLHPDEQYGVLRGFGFGAPTGVEFPAESPGRLRPPREWSRPSSASLAIGYELAVTPIQIAAAYGAIANDGVLLEPTLIREIRTPNGFVRYRHYAQSVRRVVTPEVAAKLRDLLRGVVAAGGTAERAALANFQLAAKTGTARRVVAGRYAAGQYTASFAALFPADQPQLVVVMKIDNPQKGSYFAAQTAAPVTRSMLEQALAARTVALDRARLSNVATTPDRAPLEEPDGVVPYLVAWPYVPDSAAAQPDRMVPNVTGRPLREAARALHARGFHVVVKGWGIIHHTWPAAGEHAAAGSTVTMFAEPPPLRR
ncbi:MAG TPA: penicillin-binding transpeptidase domain-containing protein [Gemmatimonadales bacterium]|nr:penicillin-binding transpeptidase domain-containing protein [Gemmatimonadales bacterium]